ncbi:MAG: c-type cytochrome [Gammaproteobacteria bacterium]
MFRTIPTAKPESTLRLALPLAGALSLFTLTAPLLNSAQAAEAVSRAALLASTCASCHGPDGQGIGDNPALAGKPAAEMVKTLQAFADGSLESVVMGRLAAGYSEAELQAVAEYFAGL